MSAGVGNGNCTILKNLQMRVEAENGATAKKAEEDNAKLLEAIEKSGKSYDPAPRTSTQISIVISCSILYGSGFRLTCNLRHA